MSPEALAVIVLAGGILVSHLLCLRVMLETKTVIAGKEFVIEPFDVDLPNNIAELVRIGADIADQIEEVASGMVSSIMPQSAPPMDIQTTIMSLIANRMMGDGDASQKEQQGAIYLQQEDTQTDNQQ